jgi:alpha-ketoglutarate-dependent 2,4-dichlorophenoxyacetate dioxygenase
MTALVGVIRPGFVAEIANIDLREPVSASDVAIIQDAVDKHPVLVFRGPVLTNEQQIAFSRNSARWRTRLNIKRIR